MLFVQWRNLDHSPSVLQPKLLLTGRRIPLHTPPARIRGDQPWPLAGILWCPRRSARDSSNHEEAADKPEVRSMLQTNWPEVLTDVKCIKSRQSEGHLHYCRMQRRHVLNLCGFFCYLFLYGWYIFMAAKTSTLGSLISFSLAGRSFLLFSELLWITKASKI